MGDAVCNHPSTVSVVRPTALHSPSIPRRSMVIVVIPAMVTVVAIRMTTVSINGLLVVISLMLIIVLFRSSSVAMRVVAIIICCTVRFLPEQRLIDFKI